MKPVLQALLVADHVYGDKATGKKIVAGIFHQVLLRKRAAPPPAEDVHRQANQDAIAPPQEVIIKVPSTGQQAGSPFLYASLTDVHGDQDFELRFVDLADDTVLFTTGFGIHSDDPVQTREVVLGLPKLPVTKAGNFALELLWNNEPLGSHRINVKEITEGESTPTGN